MNSNPQLHSPIRAARSAMLRGMLIASLVVAIVCSVVPARQLLAADGLIAITNATIETACDDGTVENGTVLISDGKILEVGNDVVIPSSAAVIRGGGMTVMPGIVDPYYVVPVPSSAAASAQRTIVFRGRTFVIGGSPAATDLSYVKVAEAFQPARWQWRPAVRSGITNAHLVTRGFGQSCLASPKMDAESVSLDDKNPRTFIAISNEPKSLKVLRSGLKVPSKSSSSKSTTATTRSTSSSSTPAGPIWDDIRAGKRPLIVNANNAAAVLYVIEEMKKEGNEKVKAGLVVSGSDALLTLESLPVDRITLVIPPRLNTEPSTRRLVNVAKEAAGLGIAIAFSLSANQTNYRNSQDIPLFSVAQLVHLGLDRDIAIQALTRTPAKLLGMEDSFGSIQKGRSANLLMFDSDPLSATGRIQRVIIDGETVYEPSPAL